MKFFFLFIILLSSLLFFFLFFLTFRLFRSSLSQPSEGDLPEDVEDDPSDLRSRWKSNENISDFPDSGGPDDFDDSGPGPQGFSISLKTMGIMSLVFLSLGLGLLNAAVYFMTH